MPQPAQVTIELGLDEVDEPAAVRAAAARAAGLSVEALPELSLLKRSLDARKGRIRFHLLIGLGKTTDDRGPALREVRGSPVLIVGDGPAGLFCAYELARQGVASVVLDRGKAVQPRRRDLRALNQQGHVDPDSNYCFGEGGAGTYSDGKLYTRSHKRGDVRDIIRVLADHGAPEAIVSDARPHIGSNRLPKVVTALRESLEAVGVRFRFEARVTRLLVDGGRVVGVGLADGSELSAEQVVLATGHSARDVFVMLADAGVRLEAKPFAVGVRIEHPQPLINSIQYGKAAGHPRLPAAAYRLSEPVRGRGVFSFCMCPGGWIVPASTEPEGLVVNGMSLSKRNSPYANSGLVVSVEQSDWERLGRSGVLAGIELQRELERGAFEAGGGALRAPAARVTDFLAGRASSTLPKSSYLPGLTATDVGAVLDRVALGLSERLRQALPRFEGRMRGYLTEEAVLVGVESRTSSPVRVLRDPVTLTSLNGLYPCGEGAGYAGGIVSAALDGLRVARAIAVLRHVPVT